QPRPRLRAGPADPRAAGRGRPGPRRRPLRAGGPRGDGPRRGGPAPGPVPAAAGRGSLAHGAAGRRQHRDRRRCGPAAHPVPKPARGGRAGAARPGRAGHRLRPPAGPTGGRRTDQRLVPVVLARSPGARRPDRAVRAAAGRPLAHRGAVAGRADGGRIVIELRPPRETDFGSPLRTPRLAAVIGIALGSAFTLCLLTGLISRLVQHPPGWFAWPPGPAWLYRVTQGTHVTSGV